MLEKLDAVLLEGDDGMGKSSLAKDVASSHPERSISIFMRPATLWGCNPDIFRETISEQMLRYLGEALPSDDSPISEAQYQEILMKLQRRIRRSGQEVVLIIDGVDELGVDETEMRRSLFNIIPLGLPGVKTVLSWNPAVKDESLPKCSCKSFVIPAMSNQEAEVVLDGLSISREDIADVNRVCRGIPGRLVSVRRLLEDGEDPAVILAKVEEFAPNLFELEWQRVSESSEQTKLALALVAYEPLGVTISHAARLLEVDETELLTTLTAFNFLELDEQQIRFASESFRRFARKSLTSEMLRALDLRIDYLLQHPEDESSLEQLPTILSESNKNSQLLEYLSPDFYDRALEKKQSLSALKRSNSLGLGAATTEGKNNLLVQFSLNQSVIGELCDVAFGRAEIYARLAVGDSERAIQIASRSPLIEDRLCLLALVAKLKKNARETIDPELLKSIRHAYGLAELDYSEDRVIQLASDLINVLPDISIEISTAFKTQKNRIEADVAIASILMQADMLESSDNDDKLSSVEEVRNQIAGPEFRVLSEVAPCLFGNVADPATVLVESEKITSIELRLPLLAGWIARNKRSSSAAEVAFGAIQMMLADKAFSPTAREFHNILHTIPSCDSVPHKMRLADIVESVLHTLKERGPTVDYVKLVFLLIELKLESEQESKGQTQLVELLMLIHRLEERTTRAECLAFSWAFLRRHSGRPCLGISSEMREAVLSALETDYKHLLKETAAHFIIAREMVFCLATCDVGLANRFALLLNTERRRDLALQTVVLGAVDPQCETIDFSELKGTLTQISDPRIRSETLAKGFRKVAKHLDIEKCAYEKVMDLLPQIREIESPGRRCVALTGLLVLLDVDASIERSAREHVEGLLKAAWDVVDRVWERIQIGFEVCAVVADRLPNLAKDFLELTDCLRRQFSVVAPETAWAYVSTLRLAIAAFSGIIPRDLFNNQDFERLRAAIERLPSYGEQALLWADLAQRLLISGKNEKAREVVNTYIHPCMSQLRDGDVGFAEHINVIAASVFWCTNPVLAKESIDLLSAPLRDEAYANVRYFLLQGANL